MQKNSKLNMSFAVFYSLLTLGSSQATDIKIVDDCGEIGKVGERYLSCYTCKGEENHFVRAQGYGSEPILPCTTLVHSYNYGSLAGWICIFTARRQSHEIVEALCNKLNEELEGNAKVSSNGMQEYTFTIEEKSNAVCFVSEKNPSVDSEETLIARPGWEYIREWIKNSGNGYDGEYSYTMFVKVINSVGSTKFYRGNDTCCMHIVEGNTLTHSPMTFGIFGKEITRARMNSESRNAQAMIYTVKFNNGPLAGQSRFGIIFMYPYKEAQNLRSFLSKSGVYPISFIDIVNTIPIKLLRLLEGIGVKLKHK